MSIKCTLGFGGIIRFAVVSFPVRALLCCMVSTSVVHPTAADAQTERTKADEIRMSTLLSADRRCNYRRGSATREGLRHRHPIQWPVTNYKGVVGVLVGAVGETTRQSNYPTEWCYINTRERGRERILTRDVRHTQSFVLAGRIDEAWDYFLSKKVAVK
jgi:hypothetical protein